MNWEFIGPYMIGATIAGIPTFGFVIWLVSRFAFRKRAAVDRARLASIWTWLVVALLAMLNGNWSLSLTSLPSCLIVWGIYHWLVMRRVPKKAITDVFE